MVVLLKDQYVLELKVSILFLYMFKREILTALIISYWHPILPAPTILYVHSTKKGPIFLLERKFSK